MRVLGAIDMAPGHTIHARIVAVSQMQFTDEDGHSRHFTWRTIQTWHSRYKKHGVTVMENKPRSDKGKTRKVKPELLLEAIQAVLPKLHGQAPKRATLYRLCIEQGLLTRSQVAPNTFSRLVNKYELFKPDAEATNKIRLAFAKAHANEMWQADTLYGPHLTFDGVAVQTRLIAFIDDASRVCCHGQFFLAENVDTLIESLRAAFYKRGVPEILYVDYVPRHIRRLWEHRNYGTPVPAKGPFSRENRVPGEGRCSHNYSASRKARMFDVAFFGARREFGAFRWASVSFFMFKSASI